MFEIKEIELNLDVFCEKINTALEQKMIFTIEDNKGDGKIANGYKGLLFYDFFTNNISRISFNTTVHKITMNNKNDTHFFYFSISYNEDNILLDIKKYDCTLLLEENICSINFDKGRYKEFQSINSRSFIHNLDGRHILLQIFNEIILIDSIEKDIYSTGNKYDILLNSFIDTFRDGKIEYIYIQNGKYSAKDKERHLHMSATNHNFFKEVSIEDDSIYIFPITELVLNMKLKSDITFTQVSTCNNKSGYPYMGANFNDGILSFQIDDFVNNQSMLDFYSISESRIITRRTFNNLYNLIYIVEDDYLTTVTTERNKEIISILENRTIISIPLEEQLMILNNDYILTVKYDQNGYVSLFAYENEFRKKKIGVGKQFFIDFDKKIILLFK